MEIPETAGWYDDPSASDRQRWWDGARWTERYQVDPTSGETFPLEHDGTDTSAAGEAGPMATPPSLATPPELASPPRHRAATSVLGLGIVAAVISMGVFLGRPAAPEPATLQPIYGEFSLLNAGAQPGAECAGSGEYSDIYFGTEVTVYDTAGDLLGTGYLRSGTGDAGGDCTFGFVLTGVQKSALYQVHVCIRDTEDFTPTELAAAHYHLSMSIS